MPTVTQPNNILTLTLDGTEINCQVIDLQFTPPGRSPGTVVETACGPGAMVTEPGAPTTGTITGTVFADSSDMGVSWLLREAGSTNAEIAFVLTMWSDQPTYAVVETGTASVNKFTWDWVKPGLGRTPLDLTVLTSVHSRPAGP